jgi:AcrR family transcriptional regulator
MSLRERNHSRTREALVDAALDLFADDGVDHVTVDEVCARAQVGRRTFFRYFPAKEVVAIAPLEDLWASFVHHVPRVAPRPTLVETLTAGLVDVLDTMPEGWSGRAATSLALVGSSSAVDARARALCRRTTTAALAALDVDPRDAEASLAGDLFATGVIDAQQRWVGEGLEPTSASLARHVRPLPALLARAVALSSPAQPRS